MLRKTILLFLVPLLMSCTDDINNEENGGGIGTDSIIELEYTKFKTYAYVQTDFINDTTEYSIEYGEKIESAIIRPYHNNIPVLVKGSKFNFSLPKAGNYVAYINGFKIIIYAEIPEQIPTNSLVIDAVKDLSCDATGKLNMTSHIQSAIDKMSSGQTLFFPPGHYLVNQLKIRNKSNINIHLQRGAELQADTINLSSYDLTSVFGVPAASVIVGRDTWPSARAFILIDQCEKINISGYGMINGRGRAARRNSVNVYGREGSGRYQNMIISRSKDIKLDGIISADPGAWNTHILKSENVTCQNVKLMNELDYAPIAGNVNEIDHDRVNTDGFDIDSSSNVLIENCFGYCGDDNVVIKSTQCLGLLDDVDGVIARYNVFLTQKSSLKVGTETGAAEMKNILFEDNDVLESDRAIALYCYDGAKISNVKWNNNRVETCHENSRKQVVSIEVLPRVAGSKAGCATSIEINNTSVREAFPRKSDIKYSNKNASSLCSQSGATSVQVKISNYSVNGKVVSKLSDYFNTTGSPSVTIE